MRPLHWSTRELLEHIRGLPQTASPPINWGFVNAWEAAGYPDIEPAPELARLAELEERLDKVANKLVEVTCKAADLSDRVAALEPKPAPPPEPARFVPTEPGWYWRQDTYHGGPPRIAQVVLDSDGRLKAWGHPAEEFVWLAPVAPYAPPTRTREQARQAPRRGDRWACSDGRTYTVLGRAPKGKYAVRQDDDVEVLWPTFLIGERKEEFLGNFAHELGEP